MKTTQKLDWRAVTLIKGPSCCLIGFWHCIAVKSILLTKKLSTRERSNDSTIATGTASLETESSDLQAALSCTSVTPDSPLAPSTSCLDHCSAISLLSHSTQILLVSPLPGLALGTALPSGGSQSTPVVGRAGSEKYAQQMDVLGPWRESASFSAWG